MSRLHPVDPSVRHTVLVPSRTVVPCQAAARASIGRGLRLAVAALQRADPTRLLLRPAEPAGDVLLACVYRAGGAAEVRALLVGLPEPAQVRLWSLDGHVPQDLERHTVGRGPGNRSALLNRLVAGTSAQTVVLVDDDVRFAVGGLAALLDAGRRLRLDVFQPAHLASSFASWDFVRRRSGVFGRETGFVEIGPLLVLTGPGRDLVLPLPEDDGMSWGLEVRWAARARATGVRLGIIDAVAVEHLVAPARSYDRPAEQARLDALLAEQGLVSMEQLHVVYRRVGVLGALRLPR